ncbi:MAG: lactate utilization protein [Rikenellaceae bacterium]
MRKTGIVEDLKNQDKFIFFDGFDRTISREERIEQKRQGILTDLFFAGVNAVTRSGSLYWRDMVGNRVAPIAFGAKRVIIITGKNKIVETHDQAVLRIKEVAAPLNALRHPGFNTPCIKTGKCVDCNSPHRICNISMTIDHCFPKNRILVVLVDEELGY